jgi:hypothetical protein
MHLLPVNIWDIAAEEAATSEAMKEEEEEVTSVVDTSVTEIATVTVESATTMDETIVEEQVVVVVVVPVVAAAVTGERGEAHPQVEQDSAKAHHPGGAAFLAARNQDVITMVLQVLRSPGGKFDSN